MKTPTSKQKPAPSKLEKGCGCVVATVLVMALLYKGCSPVSAPPTSAPNATTTPVPVAQAQSRPQTLEEMTASINDFALQPLDPKWDVEGYAKLGKQAWKTSNDLRRWAGIAALQNESCHGVSAIAVWENATRSNLSWHVVCGNDERFVISEKLARSVKARFDPEATDAEREKYATRAETAQPMSAAFTNFNPQIALTNCEAAMKEASVNSASFSPDGDPYFRKNDEAGQVTITRDFSGTNVYGATISGKYSCVVAAADGSVVELTTRDALGVHQVAK